MANVKCGNTIHSYKRFFNATSELPEIIKQKGAIIFEYGHKNEFLNLKIPSGNSEVAI